MDTDYASHLKEEIRSIIRSLPPTDEEGSLVCPIDGLSCGVPGAFADAIDRMDPAHDTGHRFHTLIAELAFVVSREQQSKVYEVHIHVTRSDIRFDYV